MQIVGGHPMNRPLAIDLFTGLHGWAEGLTAEGWRVRGYDISDMCSAFSRPRPAHIELILKDIMELRGSECADASLIVASPPCQFFSYTAMPWSKAKDLASKTRANPLLLEKELALFNACFRIQAEASIAAGRRIPMVVENVRGAQPWVGKARWNFGSFYLWGDVPALMPKALKAQKFNPDGTNHGTGSWFAIADSKNRGTKNAGGSWFNVGGPGQKVVAQNPDGRLIDKRNGHSHTRHLTNPAKHAVDENGVKIGGRLVSDPTSTCRRHGSKSPQRKMASAMIAKIPLALSSHIGATYFPAEATP